MFDLGWAELFVIGLVALIVVGPKELPRVIRSITDVMSHMRGLAREFQSGMADMAREADLEDTRKHLSSFNTMSPSDALKQAIDEEGALENDIKEVSQEISRQTQDIQHHMDEAESWQNTDESELKSLGDASDPVETGAAETDMLAEDRVSANDKLPG